MPLPEISNRITLGQILIAASLIVTVAGSVVGTYGAVESQVSSLQQQQTWMIKWVQQVQDEQKAAARDTIASLQEISSRLTDLRVKLAEIHDGQHK